MAKRNTVFYCSECGNEYSKWQGQCSVCKSWNTIVEEPRASRKPVRRLGIGVHDSFTESNPVVLEEVDGESAERIPSGISELDVVLGGGIVPGSVILIGGEPGIGKSTLTLQTAANLVGMGRRVLIVSGEESAAQVKMRADRIGGFAPKVRYLGETDLDRIAEVAMTEEIEVLIVDSIQTIYVPELESAPGSVGQVRECAARLQRLAKERRVATFIIGHVTKDGTITGPKTLEHIVDTVIYFESAGDHDHRIVRATKNRFGGLDEIGVFRMTAQGLEGVANPSEFFLSQRRGDRPGSAVAPVVEGSRPLLVEIQGLATQAPYGSGQRVARGIDPKRLALLLAVLKKHVGIEFEAFDVFVNVAGGLHLNETAGDAAIAVAIVSSALDRPVPADMAFVGEVGLGGELRNIGMVERRIGELKRMGFGRVIVPAGSVPQGIPESIEVIPAGDVGELLEYAVDFSSGALRIPGPVESRRTEAKRRVRRNGNMVELVLE